jgi:hypothetical protein
VRGIPVPQLAGHPLANATLRAVGSRLTGTCKLTTERDDPRLASFTWVCGGHFTEAVFDLRDDRRVSLGDLFSDGYAAYLSSTASAQLQADGATNPRTNDLAEWTITPYALEITFPDGTVTFPISSLSRFVPPASALAP